MSDPSEHVSGLPFARALRAALDEVAEIDWRHPAWWGVVGAAALFGRDDPRAPDRDAPPHADTFMGRRRAMPGSARERLARAVARARAALDTLDRLDGSFPGQRLRCCIRRAGGAYEQVLLSAAERRVAFVTPAGALLGRVGADPASDAKLAEALGAALGDPTGGWPQLSPIDPDAATAVPAAVAVSVLEEPLETARHLHRRAWTRGGGPWLGIGGAVGLDVITTCHMIADGYAHARIASMIWERVDHRLGRDLRGLSAGLDPDVLARVSFAAGAAPPGAAPLGIASAPFEPGEARFATLAYAMGRALEQVHRGGWPPERRRRARFSPTFQVPVAPGDPIDPARVRRRVMPGLLSVRMRDGRFEPLAELAARLPAWLARERAGHGALTLLLRAAASAPIPAACKGRLLRPTARPSAWLPPIEVLGGRACLSILRLDDDELPVAPLVAASSPALRPGRRDRRGGSVLTVVGTGDAAAVTVAGTGLTGDEAGARRLLDVWLEQVERLPGRR